MRLKQMFYKILYRSPQIPTQVMHTGADKCYILDTIPYRGSAQRQKVALQISP